MLSVMQTTSVASSSPQAVPAELMLGWRQARAHAGHTYAPVMGGERHRCVAPATAVVRENSVLTQAAAALTGLGGGVGVEFAAKRAVQDSVPTIPDLGVRFDPPPV